MAVQRQFQSYSWLEDPVYNQPAERLLTVFNKYGLKTTKLSLDSEIGNYTGFRNDMLTEECQADLALIPNINLFMNPFYTNLDALISKRTKYNADVLKTKDEITGSVAKMNYIDFYNNSFYPFLKYKSQSDPDNYSELFDAIQASVNQVREQIKLSRTLAQKKKERK